MFGKREDYTRNIFNEASKNSEVYIQISYSSYIYVTENHFFYGISLNIIVFKGGSRHIDSSTMRVGLSL